MAGCYPGSAISADADHQLKGLLDHGVRHVINLMKPDEVDRAGRPFVPYKKRLKAIAAARGCEVGVERFAIKDMGTPTRVAMGRILDRIDKCLAQNRPVYVHCLGGIGRTGTVVGCFLARHGYASDQRLMQHIQLLRKNTATGHMVSPETNEQIELIRSWVEAE